MITVSQVAHDPRNARPWFFVVKGERTAAHMRYHREAQARAARAELAGESAT